MEKVVHFNDPWAQMTHDLEELHCRAGVVLLRPRERLFAERTYDRPVPEPLEVETATGRFRVMTTVGGLAELLLAPSWPKRSGRVYNAVLQACLNCLLDQCEPGLRGRPA
jgi:hypothetical protein